MTDKLKERRTWAVTGDVLTLVLQRKIGDEVATISYALVDDPGGERAASIPVTAARGIIEQMDQFERDAKK